MRRGHSKLDAEGVALRRNVQTGSGPVCPSEAWRRRAAKGEASVSSRSCAQAEMFMAHLCVYTICISCARGHAPTATIILSGSFSTLLGYCSFVRIPLVSAGLRPPVRFPPQLAAYLSAYITYSASVPKTDAAGRFISDALVFVAQCPSQVRNLAAKLKRELAAVERFKRMEMAREAAGPTDCSAAKDISSNELCLGDTDGATAKISSPDVTIQDKLLNDLKGIAGKEAARLCSNLSSRLTPEMAIAVFQGLTLQVDALLTGSGVVAGPALNGDLTHFKGVSARQAHLAVDADALVPGFFLMADRRTSKKIASRSSSVSIYPTFNNGAHGEQPAGGVSSRSVPGPSRSTTGNTPCSRSSRIVPVTDRIGLQQLRQQEMQAPQAGDHLFRRGIGTPQKEPAGILNSCGLAQDSRVQHNGEEARQRYQAFSAPGVAGAAASVRKNSQHQASSADDSAVRSMAGVDNPFVRVGDGVQPPSEPEAARSPRGAAARTPEPRGPIAGSPRAIRSEELRMETCPSRLRVGNVNAGLALIMNGAEGGQAAGVVDALVKSVEDVTSHPASARESSSISPNAAHTIVESAAVGASLQAGSPSEGANEPNGCVSGAAVATGVAPAVSGPV